MSNMGIMKTCTKCKETKPLESFAKQSDGPKGRASWCKPCKTTQVKARYASNKEHRERVKAYNRERRAANAKRLSDYKLEQGCNDCGYAAHPAALEFDHLPEYEKEFTISAKTSYNWGRLQSEIDKCEVVCANCHAVRTANRREACQA